MTSLVERILSNDETLTELRLTEDPVAYCSSMAEFNDALRQNNVIDYIRIDRDFLPCMKGDEDDIANFFTAMGAVTSLREVHVWHAAFDIKSLHGFLQEARQLDYLEFGCVELFGTTSDFALISNELKHHPTLRVFHMVDFNVSAGSSNGDGAAGGGEQGEEGGEINTLVESLASVPQIEVVKLEVTTSRRRSLCGSDAAASKPRVHLSGQALATLLTSPTLKELQLNRINLKVADYEALAYALRSNAGQNFVSIAIPHCDLDDEGCSHLASAIASSNCRLQAIDFSCNKLTDEGCIMIASALKNNTSVKTLRLWGNVKISNSGFDALVEMLQVNCHLERVPLMAPTEYGNMIDAALLKNRLRSNNSSSSTNRAA